MGVVDRLRRMTGEDKQGTEKPGDRSAEITALRRRIETIMARRPQERHVPAKTYPPLHELIAGEEIITDRGAFFLGTEKRNAHHLHGNRPIADLALLNMEAAALLANNREIARCLVSEGLFLDTETTGLSGGTGTLAFMIGLGSFEEDAFVTRQIFIRDFSEERAALHYLADIVQTKRFLISFNGKAFDINLLAARFVLNRIANPLDSIPHLDLLFPARRLFGHRLENARLVTLEQALFGLYREDDIPGMEIPGRYFSWLRRRDPLLIMDIFRHNHLDILSLAALANRLSELIDPYLGTTRAADPRDLLAAASLLHDRREHARARNILHELTGCDRGSVRCASQKMLSLILKRNGEWEDAAHLWEVLLREHPADPFAAVELAKWYEHGCRNYAAAHDLVSLTLARSSSFSREVQEALEHRLARLQSRLPSPASE